MMEEKIMLDLEETIKNNDINNISKFYIKNNKVIDHVVEIEKRKDINDYAIEAVKNSTRGEKNSDFKGNYVNRNYQRDQEEPEVDFKQAYAENNGQVTEDETEREKLIRIFKYNSSRILHERNKYVFLASVAEDAIAHSFKYSDMIGYILIKKLFRMLCEIKFSLENQKNNFGLDNWNEYLQTKDYRKICNYINKEFELFKNYYENLNQTIIKKFHSQDSKNPTLEKLIKAGNEEEINLVLKKVFKDYVEIIFSSENVEKLKKGKDMWVHINQLLDCLNSEKVFYFSKDINKQFNFKLFYEEVKLLETLELVDLVKNKLKYENITIPL
jgi:serine/threonine-protein kinase ULK/ATG1